MISAVNVAAWTTISVNLITFKNTLKGIKVAASSTKKVGKKAVKAVKGKA